jgi:hypothetical protein
MTAPPMQVSDERLAELVARGVDRIQDDQIILDSGYEGGGYLTERADLQEQHDARKDVVAALRELQRLRSQPRAGLTGEQREALEAGANALFYENNNRVLDDKMRLRNYDRVATLRALARGEG